MTTNSADTAVLKKTKEDDDDDIPSPKLLQVLKVIFKVVNNTKIILLTATPIHDDPLEIIEIVNLFRINDKEPELMEADKLFVADIADPTLTAAEKIDKDYFDTLIVGEEELKTNQIMHKDLVENSQTLISLDF